MLSVFWSTHLRQRDVDDAGTASYVIDATYVQTHEITLLTTQCSQRNTFVHRLPSPCMLKNYHYSGI